MVARRAAWAAALVTALISLSVPASAASRAPKGHPIDLTVTMLGVRFVGTIGVPGYTETDAQIDSGTPGGRGAGVTTITYGLGPNITVHTTWFSVGGTIRAKASGSFNFGANGYTVSGAGTITGGTGRYKHASGKISFAGGQASGAPARTIIVKGTITY